MKLCPGVAVLAGLVALSAGAGVEEEILSARGTAGKPAVVRLAKGVHTLTRTLELTPENSHLRIVGEEGAVLSGGRRVRFTEADGLWRVKVPEGLDFKLLYVNGKRATRAVEPDDSGFYLMQEPVGDDHHGFRANPADVAPFVGKSAADLADVELNIWQSWDSVRLPPLAVAADGTVTTGYKRWPYFIWHAYPPRYRIENFRAALDTPGEWYLDKTAGELLYLPRPGEKVETAEGVIPLVDVLVRIDGREGSRVEDVTFEGVGFELTDAGFPTNGVIGQSASACQGAAVTVDRAKGIRFENCAFTRLGQHGIWFRDDCHDSALVRSRVEDVGMGAVRIGSQTRSSAVPQANVTSGIAVRDCILRDGGRWTPEGCGVLLQNARDCEIVHNEISGFYYTGVSIGWTWGYGETCVRNITVAYNHIHHLGWGYLSDMGAIYTLGDCDGSRIVGNYIHDLLSGDYSGWGAHGLYTDEGSHGMVFASNFVRRASTGFYQHYGKGNIFRDNVFVDPRDSFVHRGRNEEHLSFICEGNVFASDSLKVLYSGEINGGEPTRKVLFGNNLVCVPGLAGKAFFGRTFDDWLAKGEDAGTRYVETFDIAAAESRARGAAGVTGPAAWRALAESVTYSEMVAPRNPPRYSMPCDEGFEKVEVKNGMVGEFGASKGLVVVSGRAAEGTRSLLATVAEGLDVRPRLELWTTGTDHRSVLEFDFRADPNVDVAIEFKDSNPIGKPQLTVNEIFIEDGTLRAGGKSAVLPMDGDWWRLRVVHDFTGTPVYTVFVLRGGKTLASLERLPIDPVFRQWMFFAVDTRSGNAGTWEMDGFRFRRIR